MSNREIKYQVWDRYKKTMHQVIDLSFGAEGEGKTIIAYGYDKDGFQGKTLLLVEGESGDLRQFIGSKDAKGQDIYEGDVLSDAEGERFALVLFDQRRTRFIAADRAFEPKMKDDYLAYTAVWPETEKCLIVGNIYENPTLLAPHSH